jgi:hypothetical protein
VEGTRSVIEVAAYDETWPVRAAAKPVISEE